MRLSLSIFVLTITLGCTSFGWDDAAELEVAAQTYRRTLYSAFQSRPAEYRLWTAQWNVALQAWNDAGAPSSGRASLEDWLYRATLAAKSGAELPALPSFAPREPTPHATPPAPPLAGASRSSGPLPRIIRGADAPRQPARRLAVADTPFRAKPIAAPTVEPQAPAVDLEAILASARQQALRSETALPPAGTAAGNLVNALRELDAQLKKEGVLDGLQAQPGGAPADAAHTTSFEGFPGSDWLGKPFVKGVLQSIWSSR